MRECGYNVGGEQSGHIIFSDYTKTGDGIIAALQAMRVIKNRGRKASEVCHCFMPVPQILKNVRFQEDMGNPLDDARVKARITEAETALNGQARLLIRKSGTEPVIRIMAEGDDRVVLQRVVNTLAEVIRRE